MTPPGPAPARLVTIQDTDEAVEIVEYRDGVEAARVVLDDDPGRMLDLGLALAGVARARQRRGDH